ncbi:AAA family ATPase [Desertifilum sp. FACHB-1129]|uniref:ATP-dependent DNA helicase n=1 Tax=unclassified Desertifilum TaxID=2621682 RepID=UPI0016839E26|nr:MULTISPECIES: AAA family ATPase [unclassified Desertifilum]MBD2311112.1 AAA family ATPase [Desertifilum sp. FACHB-1129]MBD2323979.1 AAA family ATPase [Desertifilum sp. FACHB-866]MBD2333914.1 AAA family ATPase [Desertifilum sp. FACHB-868]MDA0211225.1 AAA family ATPase [Cyanobacteria bacterium FC1]
MTTTLTITPIGEQQQLALAQGIDFLKGSQENPIFRLSGYAGAGKSTISFALAREQLERGKRVAFCAPTHKALNVLRSIAYKLELTGVDFFTIHQLLGLSLVKRGTEKVLEPLGVNYVSSYDLVVLDECSMVSTTLWEFIEKSFTSDCRSRLILMGDPAQLYPVGEGRSPTFNPEIPGVKLTQVVRQAAGSPLMAFVTACRKAVTRSSREYRPFKPRLGTPGATRMTSRELLTLACQKTANFDDAPDAFRILAWRNKTVDYYNQAIREHHYGKQAARFVIGERLIARDPIFAPDGKTVLLQTSTEFTVCSLKETRYGHYQSWELSVEVEGGAQAQIYALHESEQSRFDIETQRLLNLAKRNPYLWKNYYSHLETYANVRPCYALTVHNAQGSTFNECGVIGSDLACRQYPQNGESSLKAMREHNRLWYVAVSRAKERIWVVC